MKKVMLLFGSPRIRGSTVQVVEELAEVIPDSGIETDIVSLAGMTTESCTVCYRCRDEGPSVLEDGLSGIINCLMDAGRLCCCITTLIPYGAQGRGGPSAHRLGLRGHQPLPLSRKGRCRVVIAIRGGISQLSWNCSCY